MYVTHITGGTGEVLREFIARKPDLLRPASLPLPQDFSMTNKVFVAGVGMIPFKKPGTSAPYDEMGAQAVQQALADAGIAYDQVQQAYAGYVYGDSTCGQKALYRVGMTGIPVVNVNNNCATGSSALFLARQAVQSRTVDVALAVGFEQMNPGALKSAWTDRAPALERANQIVDELVGLPEPRCCGTASSPA
jgi:acetyl-CoA acetyltransferase